MATLLSSLRDAARVALPNAEQAWRALDSTLARVERLGVQAIRAQAQNTRYGVDQPVVWANKPPTSVFSQIQPVNITNWDLPSINDALDQHELGFFLQSTALADAMGRDTRIPACRNTRVRALASKSGIGFSLTPSTRGNARTALDLSKEITELWWYSLPEQVIQRLLDDAIMLGVSFARIHWERYDGRVVPRLEPWWAHTVYYDWSIRRYRAMGIEGQVIIDPGSAEWFVFEPASYRSWMSGAIRGLALAWLYRNFCQNDWARYCEKHGIPIIAISEPAGHQWSAPKNAFYQQVRNIGRQGILRLPKDKDGYGFDVEFVEPRDKSWEAFKEFLVRVDTNIAVMLLGQNLTTEVQGGSYAAALIHNLVRLDYLDADAESLSTALRQYVWKPYIRFNHGREDEEATPWPTWQTRPPEEHKARLDVIKTYVDIGASLSNEKTFALAPVDMTTLATDMEIPTVAIEDRAEDEVSATALHSPQVFAYHFQYQLLTRNEGRALIGLPPVDGGEAIAMPAQAQGQEQFTAVSLDVSERRKIKARNAVGHLVRSGQLPDPNDVACKDCGHKGSDKVHHYDHAHGYADEHATEVEAVCVDCHRVRDGQNLPPEEREKREKANVYLAAYPTAPLPVRTYLGGRLRVLIDRPTGYVQRGVSEDGVAWERVYRVPYGFIEGTLGGDGEALDVYCGPDSEAPTAWWMAQVDIHGAPDEYKVGLGFGSEAEFRECVEQHLPARFIGGVFSMPAEAMVALLGEEPVARLAIAASMVGEARGSHVVTLSASAADHRATRSHRGLQAAAETARAALTANATLSAAAVETWAARQADVRLQVQAATTSRLLRTAVTAWTARDVRMALSAVKTAKRLARAPDGDLRNERLTALAVDPRSIAVRVDGEALRASAVQRSALTSVYFKSIAADYVTLRATSQPRRTANDVVAALRRAHVSPGIAAVMSAPTSPAPAAADSVDAK